MLDCLMRLICAMQDELDRWQGIAERGEPMPDVYQIMLAREYLKCEAYCLCINRIASHD